MAWKRHNLLSIMTGSQPAFGISISVVTILGGKAIHLSSSVSNLCQFLCMCIGIIHNGCVKGLHFSADLPFSLH